MDTETGEFEEQRLLHREPAEAFYRKLATGSAQVRVGMEASGHARWFERLLAELNFELWIGDAAEIRTKRVRKQKTDRQDAQLILRLLLEDRFPQIWVPSWENRDLRQLLWHRHRMVQARTRIMNQLQAVALNEGLRCKKRLWRERDGSNWNRSAWHRGRADRFGIDEVILVRLPVGFDELGRDEPHLVPLSLQCGTQEVCSCTGLKPDERCLAGSRYMPAAVPARTSCEPEPCSVLPMQAGERWSCLDRYRWMRCACDDPPDVNCRAKSYSAADHLINRHITH